MCQLELDSAWLPKNQSSGMETVTDVDQDKTNNPILALK